MDRKQAEVVSDALLEPIQLDHAGAKKKREARMQAALMRRRRMGVSWACAAIVGVASYLFFDSFKPAGAFGTALGGMAGYILSYAFFRAKPGIAERT